MFGLIGWLIIGAIAGAVAGSIMGDRGGRNGLITNIILGLVGAVVGGWLSSVLFNIDITGGQSWWITLIVAIVGAVIVIFAYRAIAGRNAV